MRMKQSDYDKAIARFAGDAEAIKAFSEGVEVLPDTHEAFKPFVPPTPKPATPTAPAASSGATREDAIRNMTADLIAQGQTANQAEANARRSVAYRREESIDPEDMTAAEAREAILNADPEAFREWLNTGSPQKDVSDEFVTEQLTAQDERLKGGVVARREAEQVAEKTAEYRKWLQDSFGYTAEQAAAVELPTVAKTAAPLTGAARMKAELEAAGLTGEKLRSALGLPEA